MYLVTLTGSQYIPAPRFATLIQTPLIHNELNPLMELVFISLPPPPPPPPLHFISLPIPPLFQNFVASIKKVIKILH